MFHGLPGLRGSTNKFPLRKASYVLWPKKYFSIKIETECRSCLKVINYHQLRNMRDSSACVTCVKITCRHHNTGSLTPAYQRTGIDIATHAPDSILFGHKLYSPHFFMILQKVYLYRLSTFFYDHRFLSPWLLSRPKGYRKLGNIYVHLFNTQS